MLYHRRHVVSKIGIFLYLSSSIFCYITKKKKIFFFSVRCYIFEIYSERVSFQLIYLKSLMFCQFFICMNLIRISISYGSNFLRCFAYSFSFFLRKIYLISLILTFVEIIHISILRFLFFSSLLSYTISFDSSFKVLYLEVSGIPLISSLCASRLLPQSVCLHLRFVTGVLRFVSPLVSRRIFLVNFIHLQISSFVNYILCDSIYFCNYSFLKFVFLVSVSGFILL